MITGLTGKIEKIGSSQIYLNVNDVEYEIYVPLNVLEKLIKKEKELISLRIYHHFKETEQCLFGFLKQKQRDFFMALLKLRNVGPNLSLSLLSHLNGEEFLNLCFEKRTKDLCRIPRMGKATAERIFFEVNSHKEKWTEFLGVPQVKSWGQEQELALEALLQLGYKEQEASRVLEHIEKSQKEKKLDTAEWIRLSLMNL